MRPAGFAAVAIAALLALGSVARPKDGLPGPAPIVVCDFDRYQGDRGSPERGGAGARVPDLVQVGLMIDANTLETEAESALRRIRFLP